jgi:hypothetical protein
MVPTPLECRRRHDERGATVNGSRFQPVRTRRAFLRTDIGAGLAVGALPPRGLARELDAPWIVR